MSSIPSALVVGGTGPTGPHLVRGLLDRGFEVTVLHRGGREIAELAEVEHIHCDPHFAEPFRDGLAGRNFDLVLSTYGRIRVQADVLAGRCGRFIGVGGTPVYAGVMEPNRQTPSGSKLPLREDDPLAPEWTDATPAGAFAQKLIETERKVMQRDQDGAFAATWFRYPMVYGPRSPNPREWHVMKRVFDHRPYMVLPDSGLQLGTRGAARNMAHAVLLAVDQPAVSAGEIYNLGDDLQLSLRQWVELIVDLLGAELEIVALPFELAWPAHPIFGFGGSRGPHHTLMDTSKVRSELDYRDCVGPRQALSETLEWYLAHPVSLEDHPAFQDRFDYSGEDALVAGYRHLSAELLRGAPGDTVDIIQHSYPHPREQNEQRDHRGR